MIKSLLKSVHTIPALVSSLQQDSKFCILLDNSLLYTLSLGFQFFFFLNAYSSLSENLMFLSLLFYSLLSTVTSRSCLQPRTQITLSCRWQLIIWCFPSCWARGTPGGLQLYLVLEIGTLYRKRVEKTESPHGVDFRCFTTTARLSEPWRCWLCPMFENEHWFGRGECSRVTFISRQCMYIPALPTRSPLWWTGNLCACQARDPGFESACRGSQPLLQ